MTVANRQVQLTAKNLITQEEEYMNAKSHHRNTLSDRLLQNPYTCVYTAIYECLGVGTEHLTGINILGALLELDINEYETPHQSENNKGASLNAAMMIFDSMLPASAQSLAQQECSHVAIISLVFPKI